MNKISAKQGPDSKEGDRTKWPKNKVAGAAGLLAIVGRLLSTFGKGAAITRRELDSATASRPCLGDLLWRGWHRKMGCDLLRVKNGWNHHVWLPALLHCAESLTVCYCKMAQDSIFNLGGEDRGTVILPHAKPKSENLALSANATRNITQDTPFTPTILQPVHL